MGSGVRACLVCRLAKPNPYGWHAIGAYVDGSSVILVNPQGGNIVPRSQFSKRFSGVHEVLRIDNREFQDGIMDAVRPERE